jgi:hypothetical protein
MQVTSAARELVWGSPWQAAGNSLLLLRVNARTRFRTRAVQRILAQVRSMVLQCARLSHLPMRQHVQQVLMVAHVFAGRFAQYRIIRNSTLARIASDPRTCSTNATINRMAARSSSGASRNCISAATQYIGRDASACWPVMTIAHFGFMPSSAAPNNALRVGHGSRNQCCHAGAQLTGLRTRLC